MIKRTLSKSSVILFSFLLFYAGLFAQKNEKDLVRKIWYSHSSFGSNSVLLTLDNLDRPVYEIRFSRTGKLVIKQQRKRTLDSSWNYLFRKSRLFISLNLRDSVETLEYKITRVPAKKAYRMDLINSSRYIKRKGDDTIALDRLTLIQGKKRKTIEYQQALTVFYQKKALRNDSIDYAVWGQFVGYIKDTILIDADQYVEHNFYKKYTDTLHYVAPLLLDTVVRIKIPINLVTGIYTQREPFTSYTTGATILAMCVGLVGVATSIVLQNNSAGPVFAQAGVVSLLTIPFSFGTGMVFSTQKFLIAPGKKSKKVWAIERHMPNLMVTQGKQTKTFSGKK